VRELRNAVQRYIALGEIAAPTMGSAGDRGGPAEVFAASGGTLESVIAAGLPYRVARQRVLDEFERRYVERVMDEHGGNVMRAAAASGIARRHLQRVRSRTQR
jgi:DNA-binding NtrC family response regulator